MAAKKKPVSDRVKRHEEMTARFQALQDAQKYRELEEHEIEEMDLLAAELFSAD